MESAEKVDGLRYSVVVPVFNEQAVIGMYCSTAVKSLPENYELLICYDFDADNTLPALEAIPPDAKPENIRLVKNELGRGVRYAIDAGMRAAKAPVVVVMMADVSDDFSQVEEMVRRCETGVDVVCGSRYMRGGKQVGGPWLKGMLSRLAGVSLFHLVELPTHDPTNSFKAYRRDFLAATPIESDAGFVLGMELTLKAHFSGGKVDEVPTTWIDRPAGESRFQLGKWLPKYLRWYLWAFGQYSSSRGRRRPDSARAEMYFRIVSALLLILIGLHCMPWTPRVLAADIDSSWQWLLHQAAVDHSVFGRDIIFTFGPLGFLYIGFHPATYPFVLAGWALLLLAFWAGTVRIARLYLPRTVLRAIWMLFIGFAVTMTASSELYFYGPDAFLLALPLLLIVNTIAPRNDQARRKTDVASLLLGAALGITSLIKFSFALANIPVVAIICLIDLSRRRLPYSTAVFLITIAIGWIAARQPIGAVPDYIRGSLEIAAGYTEAMSLSNPSAQRVVALYALSALVLLIATAMARLGAMWVRASTVLMLAALLLIGFKAGYVRHDMHQEHAAGFLLLAYALFLLPVFHQLGTKRKVVYLVGWIGMFLVLSRTFDDQAPVSLREKVVKVLTALPARGGDVLNAAGGHRRLREQYAGKVVTIRNTLESFGATSGRIDLYPNDIAHLVVTGAPYEPRPVPQSYTAYTPKLLELNAAALRGASAPDSILFTINPIDRRYPTLDDSLSWLELLSRYEPKDGERYLILTRRSQPRAVRLTEEQTLKGRFLEPVVLPANPQRSALWVRIDLTENIRHQISTLLYKPPSVHIEVLFVDGTKYRRRLIPAVARAGFLLSPLTHTNTQFRSLWNFSHEDLEDRRAVSFEVMGLGGEFGKTRAENPAYEPEFTVYLSELLLDVPIPTTSQSRLR